MTFEFGDIVKWESQAGGHWKAKEGFVAEVVPPKQDPEMRAALDGAGFPRNYESYVVRVGNKYYWPRPSQLKLVKSLKTQIRKSSVRT